MQLLLAFLQLIRIRNILIMLATLALSYVCLTDYVTVDDLLHLRFLVLCICVTCTAAAGYIINDYLDVQIDLTNKPGKVVIGKYISRRWAMFMHFVLNSTAVIGGLFLNSYLGVSIFICSVSLWLYSVYFKKQFLTGNLLVAALSAFVIAILPFFNAHISGYLCFAYAFFAFGLTLIREVVKDAEDIRGDSKFNCQTLPILLGIRKTKQVLVSILLVYIVLLFAHLFIGNSQIPFRHTYGKPFYILYMILMVFVPLATSMYLVAKADVKHHFSRLSTLYKLIMILGLLSMLIIKA